MRPSLFRASTLLATCALAAALTAGMALFPLLLLAGALVATALLAGVVAGVVGAPLTYRWAVRDAERAERRARRLASFPVIGAYAIDTPPAEAVAQTRLVLDEVTAPVEMRP